MTATLGSSSLGGVGLRAPFAGRPVRFALLAGGLLMADLLVAAAIAVPRAAMLLPLLGALAGAAVLVRFPLAVVGVLAAMSASVLHPDFFPKIGPATLYEALLVGLLLVAAFRPRRKTWGGTSGAALAVFFGLLLLAQVGALLAGRVTLAGAVNWSRPLLLVLLFFVVVRLCPDAASLRRVVFTAAFIGAVAAVVALLAAFGVGLGERFQDPNFVFIVQDQGAGGLSRVRFPGLALAYGLFWVVVALALYGRGLRRVGWLGLLGLLSIALAVSFNRNMWVGLIGGLFLMLAVAGGGVRSRLLVRLAAGATVIIVLALLAGAGMGTGTQSPLQPIVDRAGTLLNDPSTIASQQKSLQGRAQESEQALQVIGTNLLTGVGAGVHYGQYFNEERSGGRFVRTQQVFLHNQWLWLLLIGGIPLLLAWATFLATTLRRAFGPGREPLTAAAGVGLTMIMVSALVELYFSTIGMTTAVGLLAGVVHAGRNALEEPAPA